jgi:3-oxoacyl-[acyl-carrier protein] reductase
VDLESKVVLVTGSAANIGKAIALKFAKAGASVVINTRSNVKAGEDLAKFIQANGNNSLFVQADVSDPDQVKGLFAKVVDTFGTLDILVNNAGSAVEVSALSSTKEDWVKAFDSNFYSCVLCSIEAAKIMQKNDGGRIINTASIRGIEHGGRIGIMPYSAAKAAMINFTKTLAKELAPKILVNAVAPGFTLTSAFDGVSEARKAEFISDTYLKKWLTADEVADAFVYLAGADGITGEVLVIDAGWTLK